MGKDAKFITRRDALKLGVLGAGGISLIDPSNLFEYLFRKHTT